MEKEVLESGKAALAGFRYSHSDRRLLRFSGPGIGKIALLSLGLLFTMAACSGGTDPSDVSLKAAPNFPFTLYQGEDALGGSNLEIADLQGTPVVLNFWAGLCPPCRAEMPDLQLFYEEFKDDVTLVGIDVGQYLDLGDRSDAQSLLNDLGVTYPAGFTKDEKVIRLYEVFGMPTTVFINSKGEIFLQWPGLVSLEVLADVSNEMLAQKTS
ncbi:MAG: TlpA disulfide reductase family protein [Dehalococcoidia bacterium]|nr:TlpA disulfide reductase family protein [Dehalococcoidia bacterium]